MLRVSVEPQAAGCAREMMPMALPAGSEPPVPPELQGTVPLEFQAALDALCEQRAQTSSMRLTFRWVRLDPDPWRDLELPVDWVGMWMRMVDWMGPEAKDTCLAAAEATAARLVQMLAAPAPAPASAIDAGASAEKKIAPEKEAVKKCTTFKTVWNWGRFADDGRLLPTGTSTCWSKAFRRHLCLLRGESIHSLDP
jgi:hypothetical protein